MKPCIIEISVVPKLVLHLPAWNIKSSQLLSSIALKLEDEKEAIQSTKAIAASKALEFLVKSCSNGTKMNVDMDYTQDKMQTK